MATIISNPDRLTALDDYHVVRELGRGGMGVVYEAIETQLSRRVALKVLPRAAALDARQVARFQNEAQTAARLDHAHIVPVYTVGSRDAMHFYAMKYIEGCSLAEVIAAMQHAATADETIHVYGHHGLTWQPKRSPKVPLTDDDDTISGTSSPSTIDGNPGHSPPSCDYFHAAAKLGIQAAEALHHAHSNGITHGDIKPANLLIDDRGHLWLTDFGLARSMSEVLENSGAAAPGTLRYLSPEQARADHAAIDHRADIYSLGATLFELVTLQPAISGVNPSEILNQIASRKTPLPNVDIPTDLHAILCRAMAANPLDRFTTSRELAEDLQRFLTAQPVHSRIAAIPLRRRSRRIAVIAAAAALVTILVLLPLATLVPSMSKESTAARLLPAEEALLSLRALNEKQLVELGDRLARGDEPTDEDRRLLNDGPEIYLPALVSNDEKKDTSFRLRQVRKKYPIELAEAYYQLGAIHGRLNNCELQGQMLRRSVELLEQPAEQSFQEYGFPLALVTMFEAEVHAAAGRNEQANQLGSRAIAKLEALRKKDVENSDYKLGLAFLHTRFGRMLGEVLPPKDVHQHHRTAVALLEPLVQNPPPWHPNPILPYESWEDALADCRVNLASSLEPSDESKALLESALDYLSDQSEPDSMWRTSLLAQTKRVLGNLFNETHNHVDAASHLQQSIELYEVLLGEFPAVVEYRYGRAVAASTLGRALRSGGKHAEANLQFEQGIHQLQDLVDSYPAVADYQHWLAGSINNSVHDMSPSEATGRFEQALQHQLVAIQTKPQHRAYRRFATIQYSNLARKLAEQKDNQQAAVQMAHAIEHGKLAIELGCLSYDVKHQLGHYQAELGVMLSELEQGSDSGNETERVFREGIEWFRLLVDQFGRKHCDLSTLGGLLNNLALQLEDRGEIESARRLLEEAFALQKEALRWEPSNATYRQFLTNHQTNLDRLSGN